MPSLIYNPLPGEHKVLNDWMISDTAKTLGAQANMLTFTASTCKKQKKEEEYHQFFFYVELEKTFLTRWWCQSKLVGICQIQ